MKRERIGSFKAKDGNGKVYLIEKWHDVPDESNSEQQPPLIGPPFYLQLADNAEAKPVSRGVYDILREKVIRVTSDDPNAP